jgi:hypothetical protein
MKEMVASVGHGLVAAEDVEAALAEDAGALLIHAPGRLAVIVFRINGLAVALAGCQSECQTGSQRGNHVTLHHRTDPFNT